MKSKLTLTFFLLLSSLGLYGQDMHLRLELPDVEIVLDPSSPPQLLREGVPLVWERDTLNALLGFLGRAEYEQGLDYLREGESELIALLESGDPEGQLRNRAVVGGVTLGVRSSQTSAALLFLIGHIYLALENYQAAETAFLGALVPMPDYVRVHESLGFLYLRNKQFDRAQVHMARAAQLGMHSAQLFGGLGYLNFQLGHFWGAASAYQEATVMEPDNQLWNKGLLYSLIQTYQSQAAMSLVEQMLEQDPDDETLWLYRSRTALQAGEQEVALSSLETAIRLGDDSVANLQVCATLHMQIGSIGRAVALLQAGFAQGLDFVFLEQGMGWLEQQGEWEYLEQVVSAVRENRAELDPLQNSRLLVREAKLALHGGDEAFARRALQEAVELDPGNGLGLMTLAELHHQARDYHRAELLFQRASAYDLYRANALISLAQVAVDQDNFKRALQILRDVMREFPDRIELRRNIETLENLVLLEDEN